MKDIITINKKDIELLKNEAGKLPMKKSAEECLLTIMELKDYFDDLLEEIKKSITDSGKKVYPDFKGVVGANIKAVLRYYGDRYSGSNTEYEKEIVTKRLNVEKIDAYLKEKGKLPEGITERERVEKLVITRNEKQKQITP